MNISFVIITNGGKDNECMLQIRSIIRQSIPNYEIIISGLVSHKIRSYLDDNQTNYQIIDMPEYALKGRLGAMRNSACDIARYEYLVISDDDMLFTKDWYKNISKCDNFDILTPRVKLPDGTRFWDHCCYMSPFRGHIILNPSENDSHLYMSGGQSWVMNKKVFNKFRWDEDLAIYHMSNMEDYRQGKHNEDTEYSLRCRQEFKIQHNHNVVVYHNDPSYTSYGRVVRRRFNKASFEWCKNMDLPPQIMLDMANHLLSNQLEAEAVDLFRKIYQKTKNESVKTILNDIDNQLGGPLDGSYFTFDNIEYQELVS